MLTIVSSLKPIHGLQILNLMQNATMLQNSYLDSLPWFITEAVVSVFILFCNFMTAQVFMLEWHGLRFSQVHIMLDEYMSIRKNFLMEVLLIPKML